MVTWTFEAIKMKAELTAIIEAATEGGYWAICPEIAGANGQGQTITGAKASLKSAIQLILEDCLNEKIESLS
jgi:predicted RNase H-like HicB family nuclease